MFNSRREETAQRKKLKMLEFSEVLTGLSHQGGEALGPFRGERGEPYWTQKEGTVMEAVRFQWSPEWSR